MTTFTDDLWTGIGGLMEKIFALPFIQELAAGTLARDRFRFYVTQDSLYLNSSSRALSIAAARSPDAHAMLRFAKSAQEAIEVERRSEEHTSELQSLMRTQSAVLFL